ncbi:Isochorismatase-like protein [Xylogone sp. PMI_703]|nr:Isochorismatase-like protein [Xylogone sp. PMI_703]
MTSFYVPVDIKHTALLLSDVQIQIIARFPEAKALPYMRHVQKLIELFRQEIAKSRSQSADPNALDDGVPLIVHHVLPFGINNNAFVSRNNKLSKWAASMKHFTKGFSDPNHPNYAVPATMVPPGGWGSSDEIIISKLQPGCFSSSELLSYFRARGIRHVILCGLTTAGSILGSARLGADLDYHIIIPRDCVMDDDEEVNSVLLDKVLPRFVDVVDLEDIESLF